MSDKVAGERPAPTICSAAEPSPERGAQGYLIPTTCVDCGKSGEMWVINPGIIHKTIQCQDCLLREAFNPFGFLDKK